MGGGLLQLVAYGAQDIYLTGNPQITFWKVVYRRHTHFSVESIEGTFNGQADWGKKVTCTISRNGDLISAIYLHVKIPDVVVPADASGAKFRWLNWLGHTMVKEVSVQVGGQRIDKIYGEWLQIWNELTQTPGHQLGYAEMVGNSADLVNPTEAGNTVSGRSLYIPLTFWFCRNPGLALPLIALQYHEVRIELEFREVKDCYWVNAEGMGNVTVPPLASSSLLIDYIYLDTDERRRMAQNSHEYLIEQLQFGGAESATSKNHKAKLNFNHPVKEIVFIAQPTANVESTASGGPQWFNFTDTVDDTYGMDFGSSGIPTSALTGVGQASKTGKNPVVTAKLQLNGHDRMQEREGSWFNMVVPYATHQNIPSPGINVFSFALKPEEHQPTGTCNFSRVDNATLNLTLSEAQCDIKIYATNFNVFRCMSGMGGLAYAN